ncbi:MAG: NADP-dependent oxidoreductase [Hyphomicrobiaceae bacterium]|nr:NADP-dependent oxidoreductase [Hyphomicrobiaceae bacterium]
MKAVFVNRYGGLDALTYGDLPDPVPQAGEVLVDIQAASVNAADVKVREGATKNTSTPRADVFPCILGRDFSGIVAAKGPGAVDLEIGQPVFGVLAPGRDAAYAEKVAEKAAILCPKPESLSHVDAAAIALIGLTAIVSLEETLKLRRGETILIQGGAGGVASFAIQLAKHVGAKVITTASAANHDYVRSLGADLAIDYTRVDFAEVVRDVDTVLETVGGDVAARSYATLRPGGRIAFIGSGPSAPPSPRSDVTALRPAVGRDRRHLQRIVELHAKGIVSLPEIRTFALRDAADAQRISESRHFRGKLVLQVR